MKNTEKTLTRQQKPTQTSNLLSPTPLQALKARSHSLKHSPFFFVSRLSAGKKRLLNHLIWMHRNWKVVKPSQNYMAQRVGLSREYVNTLLAEFQKLGIIEIRSEHMQTCFYTLNPFFDEGPIKRLLKSLLPAIMCFSLSLLSVQSKPDYRTVKNALFAPKKNLTPYNTPSFSSSLSKDVTVAIENSCSFFRKKVELMKVTRRYGGFQFTEYGLIRLSAYPYPALADAVARWKIVGDKSAVKDPFKWFCWIADRYCKARKLKPEWALMQKRLNRTEYTDKSPTYRYLALKDSSTMSDNASKTPQKGNERPIGSSYTPWKEHVPREKEVTTSSLDEKGARWLASLSESIKNKVMGKNETM